MKLTKEIITAVRATAKKLKKEFDSRSVNRYEEEPKAIQQLLKSNPAIHRTVIKNKAIIHEANKRIAAANEKIKVYGFNQDIRYITDSAAFLKHGGVIPPNPRRPDHAEILIARLAAAKPAEGAKILAELGIDWS